MKTNNFDNIPVSFSATELSLMHQGLKCLIKELNEKITTTEEPYLRSVKSSLERLNKLENKLSKLNIEIEDQVLELIKSSGSKK